MPFKDPERQKKAQHESYLRNKDEIVNKSKNAKASKQRFVNAVKSFPCTDCGASWPPCAMHLDHLDPTEKLERVSYMLHTASWQRLVEEIMKCELVCACCHALRTTPNC